MKTSAHLIISGKVQGVWFRASTKQKAEQLGIAGWVKNTDNGRVEALIEGDEKQIQDMIKWCHQGPPLSRVKKVEVKNIDSTNGFNGFEIKY